MKNGWLVKTDEEWIEAFTTLVKNQELRRKLGEAARKSVLKNYSRHIIKLNYLSILNQQVDAKQ